MADSKKSKAEGSAQNSTLGPAASGPSAPPYTPNEPYDPSEVVLVPFIMTVEKRTAKHLLPFTKTPPKERVVKMRQMTRDNYQKHYAKDPDGNYVGTEKPAVDAGLVYVLGKSTPEDLEKQIRQVAFGKEHEIVSFGGGYHSGVAFGGAYQ